MDEKEYNKQLIEKYPWLLPRNVWTDKVPEDYDYSHTLLDEFPTGWRIAFGEQMCVDIQRELDKLKPETAADFRVVQIKEKFGSLRFYTNWVTEGIDEVIRQYENLSERTCIHCGASATQISAGWISPWCDICAEDVHDRLLPIDEFFKQWNDE